MLSSLVKSQTTSPEEKTRYLGDLTEIARRMVTSLDEIVWAVNPRNDTIASLASYFEFVCAATVGSRIHVLPVWM